MAGLIGLDWGTSSVRAYRFDATGAVREARHRPHGIRALPAGGFDAVLADITAGWPRAPRIACGMVGARGGWLEMPYLDLPVGLDAIGDALGHVVAADGGRLHIVPGLRDASRPDVVRGEETQVLGAVSGHAAGARSTLVLPGTHSKWVDLRGSRVVAFHTAMTGELFALLRAQSILAAGIGEDAGAQGPAFLDGVADARDSGSAGGFSRLFALRAAMLSGVLAAADLPARLSGLLVGEEIRMMIATGTFDTAQPVCLIGDEALCARYAEAFGVFGMPSTTADGDAAARGLWRIAAGARLTDAAVPGDGSASGTGT